MKSKKRNPLKSQVINIPFTENFVLPDDYFHYLRLRGWCSDIKIL